MARDLATGVELWVSDGTPDGTHVVLDLCPGACSSYPRPAWVAGGLLYFEATPVPDETHDGAHVEGDRYLFRTDGTAGGTVLLAAVRPGDRHVFLGFDSAGALGELPDGRMVFLGDEPEHGQEPWVTDGTAAGTRLLADIVPGSRGSSILRLLRDIPDRAGVVLGSRVLFVAWDEEHGFEPWVTDGTSGGTRVLQDILPGAGSSEPFQVGTAGDLAYFSADDGVKGRELWATDGTPGGTRRVADLTPGAEGTAFPSTRTGIDGREDRAYFLAVAGAATRPELWVTDGTSSGTRQLTRFSPMRGFPPRGPDTGFDGWDVHWFEPLFTETGVLFWADDGAGGLEPWRTDGTRSGTRSLLDLCAGPCGSFTDTPRPVELGDGPGEVVFSARDAEHDTELWFSDGTAAGSRRVDVPGPLSRPRDLREFDGGVLFLAWDGIHAPAGNSVQLWHSRGTDGSTVTLTGFGPGAFEVSATVGAELDGAAAGDHFVFGVPTLRPGGEVWRTDGTVAGTVLLKDLALFGDRGSNPAGMVTLGGRVYFRANDEEIGGYGLWSTDGTPAGTRRVIDPREAGAPGELTGPWRAGDALYFAEIGPFPHPQTALWTLGAHGGDPQFVAELSNDGSTFEELRTEVDGRFLYNDQEGYWITDGGAAPPTFLGDLGEPVVSRSSVNFGQKLAHVGDRLFLLAWERFGEPIELWRIGAEPAAAVQILDGVSGPRATGEIVPCGDEACFLALDGDGVCSLWRSDGTAAGTREALPVPGMGSGFCPSRLIATESHVFWQGSANGEAAIWATDGTLAGTAPALRGSFGFFAVAVGDRLLVSVDDGVHGRELWTSDGTPAGSALVADLHPGPEGSDPDLPVVFDGQLYFTAYDGITGRQLWRTDGTLAGTSRLTERLPPYSLLVPGRTALLGNLLVFVASDRSTGEEPWAVSVADGEPVPPPPPPAAEGDPPPPAGAWLTPEAVPGFRFKVRIAQGAAGSIAGAPEPLCIPETLCVSGALPGRSEVFLRVVGPRPNGKLWPTLVKFTTSEVEVWIEQLATGAVRYYRLEGASPGVDELPGLFDRDGFDP